MEIDTGATLSVMSEATYMQLWTPAVRPQLRPSTEHLLMYTGESIAVLGQISLCVSYQKQNQKLRLLFVAGVGPTLMGWDWLESIKIDWHIITVYMLHPLTLSSRCLTGTQTFLMEHLDRFWAQQFPYGWIQRNDLGFARRDQYPTRSAPRWKN